MPQCELLPAWTTFTAEILGNFLDVLEELNPEQKVVQV